MADAYPFLKGHGTENDFVLLPDHDGTVHGDLTRRAGRALCDRRAGIGGDGVLRVIRTARSIRRRGTEAEWFMDYRNADGSRRRCAATASGSSRGTSPTRAWSTRPRPCRSAPATASRR